MPAKSKKPAAPTAVRLVLVKWRDIVNLSGWTDEAFEKGEHRCPTFYTVGFVVEETKEHICLSDSYMVKGALNTFPKGCIDEIRELRFVAPKNYSPT